MFKHVIVPLDGSRGSTQAVPVAARLAKCMAAGMVLVRVLPPPGADEAALEPNLARPSKLAQTSARAWLERLAAQLRPTGIPVRVELEQGRAAELILATIRQYDDAIVVMRSRNRSGRLRLGLGSVASEVVRAALAPVLVLPFGRRALPPPSPYEPLPQGPLRILVPLDGSPLAEDALGPACELLSALALPGKGEILLLRVVSPFASDSREAGAAANTYLQEEVSRLHVQCAAAARQTVKSAVVFESEVPLALIQVGLHGVDGQGPGFDLVVMTTHGEGGLERAVLGGVTEQVLYQTHLPVVVVHPRREEHDLLPTRGRTQDVVLLSSIESFPASDAPGWQPLSI
ncbi:MAG TPA: universal stress protein [Ktedonobacterales bacterium]